MFFLAFKSWKDIVEEENTCSYGKSFGTTHNAKGQEITNWQCNRSGKRKTNGVKKRRTKSSGET